MLTLIIIVLILGVFFGGWRVGQWGLFGTILGILLLVLVLDFAGVI